MLPRGSTRRTSGPRSGVRSRRAAAHSLALNAPNNNNNGLQNDHLHEFHEAGMGNYAQGLGASQNGTIVVSNAGQSISIDSGSAGSPSRGSDTAMATPVPNSHMSRLQHLDAQREDFEPPETVGTRKKKRGPRVAGGDKGGRGLRQFSMKVCEKVESKGRTTYNEVADELVAEFANLDSPIVSPDRQQYDEKNIRRRVYDALNVLMAMDIISKEKKEIKWKGLPSTSINDTEQLKAEHVRVKNAIEKKTSYLRELEEQIIGLQNLVQRNERLYGSGNAPSGGVALPFILVQTRPHATVEVEISEDMQLVHFDFNSTPFGLHDDAYVLKEMKFCKSPSSDGADLPGHKDSWNGIGSDENSSPISNMYQHCMSPPPMGSVVGSYQMPCTPSKLCNSPPVPGILKARVKHENIT